MQVNSDGLISFRNPLNGRKYGDGRNITLPSNNSLGDTPFIAPFWSDYDLLANGGNISFRATSDGGLMTRAVGVLSENNTQLSSFEPELLFIVTWCEAASSQSPTVVSFI